MADLIVVGSGLGGLCAATLAAHRFVSARQQRRRLEEKGILASPDA